MSEEVSEDLMCMSVHGYVYVLGYAYVHAHVHVYAYMFCYFVICSVPLPQTRVR